jgi:hypothetical protein
VRGTGITADTSRRSCTAALAGQEEALRLQHGAPSSRRCQSAPETAPTAGAAAVRRFSTTSRAARFARRRRHGCGRPQAAVLADRPASGPARPIARGLSGAAHRHQRPRTTSSAARPVKGSAIGQGRRAGHGCRRGGRPHNKSAHPQPVATRHPRRSAVDTAARHRPPGARSRPLDLARARESTRPPVRFRGRRL